MCVCVCVCVCVFIKLHITAQSGCVCMFVYLLKAHKRASRPCDAINSQSELLHFYVCVSVIFAWPVNELV